MTTISKFRFILSVIIWAIMARIVLPIKAKWAKTGKYPGFPTPHSKEERYQDKISEIFNDFIGGILKYLYERKGVGIILHGVVSDRGGSKIDIIRLLNRIITLDTIGCLPFEKGFIVVAHGSPSGHVYYRDTEAKPRLRYPEEALTWADLHVGKYSEKYLLSCFNEAKGNRIWYEGTWNYLPTGGQKSPMAFAVIGDGDLLVSSIPEDLAKFIFGI